jgi:hypothetical protein
MNNDNKCVFCDRDTSIGSGWFVNRIPADNTTESGEYLDGYSCSKCMEIWECDLCGDMIPLDEDVESESGERFHEHCKNGDCC